MDEFSIIKKYLRPLSRNNPGAYNLQDDVFLDHKKKQAVSVDTYVENVHFFNSHEPKKFLKKIIRASLSDLYCKGIEPKYYFLSFAIGKKIISKKWLKEINKILKSEQKKFKIILSGGDTTSSKNTTITVISVGNYNNFPILRKGAKKNNDIYVTGNLGDSFVGLNIIKKKINLFKDNSFFMKKYYEPNISYKLSKYLFRFATSAIDISDGLIQDLQHICDSSHKGAIINLELVPISSILKKNLKKLKIKKSKIISQGDDYQILFTSNPLFEKKILKFSRITNTKITKIGKITKGNKIKFVNNSKNNAFFLKNRGYTHLF